MGDLVTKTADIAMAAEGQKSTHFRVAFAVACGLALCCAVMYVTADGADEADMVKAEWKYHNIIPKVHRSAMAKTSELGAVKGLRSANFVYINGRSVGLSTKLNDFAKLASRM